MPAASSVPSAGQTLPNVEISLAAEKVFQVGSFPVTNTLIASSLTVLTLGGLTLALRRPLRLVPRGFQNLLEAVVEQLLKLMDSVTCDRRLSKRFFPLVATLFLFILVSNWLGLLPGFGTIGVREVHDGQLVLVPLLRSVNADLNFTLALAIISVLATQIIGIALLGVVKFSRRYFVNPLKSPFLSIVGILELFSEVAKLISFSFRLFGNIFAGEVLLVVISSLLPFLAPLPFYFLEIFVGLIQAFIFAVLTLVFLRVATAEAGH